MTIASLSVEANNSNNGIIRSESYATSASQGSGVETFALTMLSCAEKALRESSNTNAPIECWGCHGLFSDSNHLYKDCPHKYKPQVQEQFKRKLEEFLAKKKKNKFDPQTY